MIVNNELKYINYIQNTKQRVNNICAQIPSGSDTKKIFEIRDKIFAKTSFFDASIKIAQILGIETANKITKEIDELCTELETIVNTAIANAHLQQNQEYTSVNRR